MIRSLIRTMLIALFLTASSASSARAEGWFNFGSWGKKATPVVEVSNEAVPAPAGAAAVNDDEIRQAGVASIDDEMCEDDDTDYLSRWKERRLERKERKYQELLMKAAVPGPCYPELNSSLYPSPRPDVPYEVGQTLITNQAFYPHEMLYAHRYKALYPPYFYENKCGLTCLPFFPKPCLKGTVVKVKYRSRLPLGFSPPSGATKTCFSNTQFR